MPASSSRVDALTGAAGFASAAARRALLRQATRIRAALLDHRAEARDVLRAFVDRTECTPFGTRKGRGYTFEANGTYGALFGETHLADGVPDGNCPP